MTPPLQGDVPCTISALSDSAYFALGMIMASFWITDEYTKRPNSYHVLV
jgi:hypothetical protein